MTRSLNALKLSRVTSLGSVIRAYVNGGIQTQYNISHHGQEYSAIPLIHTLINQISLFLHLLLPKVDFHLQKA